MKFPTPFQMSGIRIATISLLLAGWAHAQTTVVNTLNNASSGDLGVFSSNIQAQGFSTGNTTDLLNSVTVNVATPVGNSTYAGLSVALYASDATTFIGNLTGPSSGNAGLSSFTPVTPITLSANTTYFVEFRDSENNFNGAELGFTGSAASNGTGSATYLLTSSDGGASYTVFPVGILQFSVTEGMSAVPEPSTYALIFGAAALGFAVYRRRTSATTV